MTESCGRSADAPAPLAWPSGLCAAPYADGAEPELPRLLAGLLDPSRTTPGRDVVVLLDGVGAELLADHLSLAPTLRALRDRTRAIRTVAPTTTATAMTSLTTGAAPLQHGTLGYTVIDPDRSAPLQQLTGDAAVDPRRWMPLEGLAAASPRRCVHVGPAKHAASFLTRAAYSGWEFTGHRRRDERVDAVRLAVRRAGSDGLVLVHVDDVDHAGHRHGTDSVPWRDALAEADAMIAALLRRLPGGTRLRITADHGMVDTAPTRTIDLAQHPEISRELAIVAGESRCLMLRTRPEADPGDVADRVRAVVEDHALVLEREQILASGLLGPVGCEIPERVAGRIPDLAVLARGRWIITDTAHRPPQAHPEVGVHGSLTRREALVPLIDTII